VSAPAETAETAETGPVEGWIGSDVCAKIIGAFGTVGISCEDLETVVGGRETWTDVERVDLLAKYKELKAGALTVEAFKALSVDDF
jgi:hypothetical protein